ncbi:MAG: glycosyltransferase family 9 protein [Bacteroidetes bacterium]|nr:glycosyltransferase family 9 protein [Bacteroidota bacterium]
MNVEHRCRFFKGDIPCVPHKQHGVHCEDCTYKDIIKQDILIIKLGAIGDVIRTTPILHRLKADYPNAKLWWVTRTPEILPDIVDVKLPFSLESIMTIVETPFLRAYNFDKDREACALLNKVQAKKKFGFELVHGVCSPINTAARYKYLTGLFDDVNKANTKSYLVELFEMAGYEFSGEEYILPFKEWHDPKWKFASKKKVVGLNTGCGGRWTSRLWPDKYWVTLAKDLKKNGYEVVLLGGEQEHEKNSRLAKLSGAKYFGHYSLNGFINLMNHCDLVVTAVTMALHIAIGLKKRIVLFNNIFNKHEFELYGRGIILEPEYECSCYFSPTCPNNCMQYLVPSRVIETIKTLLPVK